MPCEYTAYRNLTRALRGDVPGPEGSIEKLFWSEMYQRQIETAVALARAARPAPGGVGRTRSTPADWPHLFLYARGRTIAAGTSEVQRNIIAERVLRLPKGQ